MRSFLSLIATFFVLILLLGSGSFYTYGLYKNSGPLTEKKTVLIKRGSGVSVIAQKLENENIIHNALVFKIATRLTDQQSVLKAGEYEFQPHQSMQSVLDRLADGDIIVRQITFPEGLTSFEMVRLLNDNDDLTNEGKDKIEITPKEGALLPDTYRYQIGDTAQDIILRMQGRMTEVLDEAWENRTADLPITTKEEALILASVVEKETGKPEERRAVSGVFTNRLNKGMLLQTDPTVIYAITKGKHKNGGRGPLGRRLLTKDLKINSPYNTYKYEGLPPGPICNPGKASIEAALNPENHEYIFFVADGTGGHAFAKTVTEHNRNVSEWRKARRNQ